MIKARNISHNYNQDTALKGVNFEVARGEFVSIVGESGSGKSTLLSILSTLLKPTSGSLEFEGLAYDEILDIDTFRRQNIGFVFQFHYLINYLTIKENIQIANEDATNQQIIKILELLNIEDIIDRFPHEISGGQRQRVAIARALINKPKIIFADEPTGNLDSKNSKNVFELLKNITQTEDVSVVVATHDLQNAQSADTIYEMNDGHISNYN